MRKKRIICLLVAAMTLGSTFALANSDLNKDTVQAATKTVSKGELIRNTSFKAGWGLPWSQSTTSPAEAEFNVGDGYYEVTVNKVGDRKADSRWAVNLQHDKLTLENGHEYNISYTIKASEDCKVYSKIGRNSGDYKEFWNNDWKPVSLKAGEETTVKGSFVMKDETEGNLVFQFQFAGDCAAEKLPCKCTITNVSIKDDKFAGYVEDFNENGYAIRTNQIGYFTKGEKTATVVTNAKEPIEWKLLDLSSNVVTKGQTSVYGNDAASGDFVHRIDFSNYQGKGKGYKLVIDSAYTVPEYNQQVGVDLKVLGESAPFEVGDNIYSKLKYDALKYFYHNRSAVPIEAKYTDGREDLARPAGHTSELLKCAPGEWYKGDYSLDVTGGWYDAGDHGKYVVNSGISTWTLQNAYERAANRKEDLTKAPYGDNTMNIPESGNGIPDILDESRFNLEFMLKMQVPDGKEYEGMAHHTAHDFAWTGLGMRPDEDTQTRYIYAPSTAATLNLAATAAQGARIWKSFDESFSNKCLESAKKAWKAAIKNPDIYAPKTSVGGGTYDDDNVEDEFYWAACELYATTGDQEFLDYMKSSKYYLSMPMAEFNVTSGVFNWGYVNALGTMSLIASKNNLPQEELNKAKASITESADRLVEISNNEGYGVAFSPKTYVWGSNGDLSNLIMILSYANDINGASTRQYIDAANKSMDYMLGNNANTKCYVSGYGINPLKNPHHRFWAHELDSKFPLAPAGVISGGANGNLDDPYVKGTGWVSGVRPAAKCYVDDIQSYSTNECAINWNAPFTWVSAYLDDHSGEYKDIVADNNPVEVPDVIDNSNVNNGQDKQDEPVENVDQLNNEEDNDEDVNEVSKTSDATSILSLIGAIGAGISGFCLRKRK